MPWGKCGVFEEEDVAVWMEKGLSGRRWESEVSDSSHLC